MTVFCLGCLLAIAPAAVAGDDGAKQDLPGPVGADRTVTEVRQPLTEKEIAEHLAQGKLSQLDLVAREKVIQHITDYLPADWKQAPEPWGRVDSYGDPILNEVPGWPGWTERNVAALRDEIRRQLDRREASPAEKRFGAERLLGNFLAQAIIRDIDVDDLVDLEAVVTSSDVIAREVREQLHLYENVRAMHLEDAGQAYTRTVYPARVVRLIESLGKSMEDVQALDARSKVPTTMCSNRETFTRGMTHLAGPTIIWQVTGDDDSQADVPIGFHFYFNACEDQDANENVRVSTNGYITFFEQGGGALDGTDYSNDAIPDAANTPHGFVAPAWDDYIVATAQGDPDTVSYLTEGAVGSRVFTVEWYSVSRLGGSVTDYHDFQAKLYEATGNVELHLEVWDEDVGQDNATIGIESFDGTVGDCGPNCGNTIVNADITDNYRFVPWRPLEDSAAACLASDISFVSNNFNATGVDATSCGYNDFTDVWYTYHAPVAQNVTFSTCAFASFDTTLAVFDSSATTEIGCSDDLCGNQSEVTVPLAAETDYKVRVAGYNGLQGFFDLSATPDVVAQGDDCGTAWPLPAGFSYWSTASNSGCVDETSCALADTIDEWFAWTPAASGRAVASTISAFSSLDTSLAAFSSCGGAEFACNDDAYGTRQSQIFFPVSAGSTYYLRVAGVVYAYGNYAIKAEVCLFCDEFESGNTSGWSATLP